MPQVFQLRIRASMNPAECVPLIHRRRWKGEQALMWQDIRKAKGVKVTALSLENLCVADIWE
jgi:hypothetical protein